MLKHASNTAKSMVKPMNDGYLSLVIILMGVVLVASGWHPWLIGGVPRKHFYGFVLLWGAGMPVRWEATERLQVSLSLILCLSVSLAVWLRSRTFSRFLHLLFAVLLVSLCVFILEQLHRLQGVPVWVNPLWDLALLSGFLAALTATEAERQVAVMTWALALNEWLQFAILDLEVDLALGNAAFFDRWWLGLGLCRLYSLLMLGAKTGWNRVLRDLKRR